MTDEAPSTFRLILRELPRRKVALVLLVVIVNLGVVMCWRGCAIAAARPRPLVTEWYSGEMSSVGKRVVPSKEPNGFVLPWEWTADEWRETFLWK